MQTAIASPADRISKIKQSVTHRSSALFFAQADGESDTILTFLNHFLVKRGIPSVRASLIVRDERGQVVKEARFVIDEPRVYALSIRSQVTGPFVGSAEIVFESEENLAVPYCAVTAVYRTRYGLCQLHAYSRRYNAEEVGTSHATTMGAETGWTIRDGVGIDSFFVLHGGPETTAGEVGLTIRNADGGRCEVSRLIDRTAHDTRVFGIRDFDVDPAFLGGREAIATIHFKTDNVFPRLICGIRRVNVDGQVVDFQATHSNFDYSIFNQPKLDREARAWIDIPGHLDGLQSTLILYPGFTREQGLVLRQGDEQEVVYPGWSRTFEGRDPHTLGLLSSDGQGMPSRLVAGVQVHASGDALPCECSAGALTSELGKVHKRFYWGLAAGGEDEAWLSAFFHPIADMLGDRSVIIKLYDTEGACGGATLGWHEFERGPVELRQFLDRMALGPVFYTCFVEGAVAWFYCYIFDRMRRSGGLEHSF